MKTHHVRSQHKHVDGKTSVANPNETYSANVGEVIQNVGQIVVTDQDGNLLCEQVLYDADTVVSPATIFLQSSYDQPQNGGVAWVGELGNPSVFAASWPGSYNIEIKGFGCPQYVSGPVVVGGVLNVASSSVGSYPGRIAPQPYYDSQSGFFNFDFPDGTQSTIGFGNVINNTSETGDYGFLQLVTSSVRSATLADSTLRYIANFDLQSLDDHDNAVMSPTQEGVPPGGSFNLVFSDAPGFQIVKQWRLPDGTQVDIESYAIADAFAAYLMYRSRAAGAQWVPVAQVNWSVSGVLRRRAARPPWEVDTSRTVVIQPNVGAPLALFPSWIGVAHDRISASIVDGCYQTRPEARVGDKSVRY